MPRKEHLFHFIYKTTCIVNEKFYVGMHSTSNLEDGYIGSGKYLWNSIRKYGKENFKFEILEWHSDRRSLKEREKELVNEEFLQHSLCMNLKCGGEGGLPLLAHKIQSAGGSASHRKRNLLHLSKLKSDAKYRENFSLSISKAQKRKNSFQGKTHTLEWKESASKRAKISQAKEKNSQYGTMWIHKDGISKKIPKEELQEFKNSGWTPGRKM